MFNVIKSICVHSYEDIQFKPATPSKILKKGQSDILLMLEKLQKRTGTVQHNPWLIGSIQI